MVLVHAPSPVSGLKRLLRSQKTRPHSISQPSTWGAPIETLPAHILHDIGNRAGCRDLLHLSLCSRHLRTALIPVLYSTVELKTNKHCKATLLALSKSHDIAQHVRRLIIRPNALQWTESGDELDENGIASLLAAMASHLRGLEAFEWDGIEMPHDGLWLALRKSCRSLRRISTSIGEAPLNASSPLWDFSDLRQVALNVKCHSLDWLAEGLPKTEKLPRKFWAMLLERCPRLEELTIGGCAPSPRVFDARHVTAGRWPRLHSVSLGGVVLLAASGDPIQAHRDDAAFQAFFAAHTGLRSITLQHAEGSAQVPTAFVFPLPAVALPHLESFAGPLRLARSLPAYTRGRTLRRLALTTLHHSASAFPPTCAVLQEEFPALRSLGVWIDLSFGQAPSASGSRRSSAERDRMGMSMSIRGDREKAPAFDDMLMLRALLAACPLLTHIDVACFTRPTFSFREFSRVLQSSAPNMESFTLTKIYKSGEDSDSGSGMASASAATRLVSENPRLRGFIMCTTLDSWINPSGGRVRWMGQYEVLPSAPPTNHDSEHGYVVAPHATLLAREYGQRNITGRMYTRHFAVPVVHQTDRERHRDSAPPSSFPGYGSHGKHLHHQQSMSLSLSRDGSVNSHRNSYATYGSESSHDANSHAPSRWGSLASRYTNTDSTHSRESHIHSNSPGYGQSGSGSGSGHTRAESCGFVASAIRSESPVRSRSRRSSVSNVVGSIACALVRMKSGSRAARGSQCTSGSGTSGSHGSATSAGTTAGSVDASLSGPSRSGSGDSSASSGSALGASAESRGLEPASGRQSVASSMDGFILV